MTATLAAITNPTALGEPTPGSPEALLLLANAGVLPASAGTDDPRFSADAITSCVSRLLEVKQQQELLANEQKEINEQLRLAHLRGDLLTLLPVTWTPKTEPVLMRASQPARLGQEKPHETQAPHSRADHPQAAHC